MKIVQSFATLALAREHNGLLFTYSRFESVTGSIKGTVKTYTATRTTINDNGEDCVEEVVGSLCVDTSFRSGTYGDEIRWNRQQQRERHVAERLAKRDLRGRKTF